MGRFSLEKGYIYIFYQLLRLCHHGAPITVNHVLEGEVHLNVFSDIGRWYWRGPCAATSKRGALEIRLL